ncbi:MAG TPA: phosphatidate cytidylyltransferase, partial [Xanthomarina gelatinilytica]|nr:phosphatidate cytidylyltransferase [Xanthomarina gelatinilytica]
MKEILVRSFSGLLYVSLLVFSLYNKHVFILLFFLFGLICLAELKKLIQYR